jgi:hypothetical protein
MHARKHLRKKILLKKSLSLTGQLTLIELCPVSFRLVAETGVRVIVRGQDLGGPNGTLTQPQYIG